MTEAEAFASDDRTLADWLAGHRRRRRSGDGFRQTYDPVAHLWLTDTQSVINARERRRRRQALGTDLDVTALNRHENSNGLDMLF